MNNDLKSSEALKAYAREVLCGNKPTNSLLIRMFDEIIDNAPTVNPCKDCDLYFKAMTKAELDKMSMISKKHKGGAE